MVRGSVQRVSKPRAAGAVRLKDSFAGVNLYSYYGFTREAL